MKVLSEINLNNANIDPSDFLNKKAMQDIMGGYPYCCCFCTWNSQTYCGYCGNGNAQSCAEELNMGSWGEAECHCSCV